MRWSDQDLVEADHGSTACRATSGQHLRSEFLMSIRIAGYTFEGPFSSPTHLEDRPGLYVILCRRGPDDYLIDLGEADQIRTHVENGEREDRWTGRCMEVIRYAAIYTPNMHRAQRQRIEKKIREEYRPHQGKS